MASAYPYEALYKLSRELHDHRLDVQKIIHMGIARAGKLTGLKQGCLVTFDDDGSIQHAHVLNADKSQAISAELWETLLTQGLVGYVYFARRTIIIPNIAVDTRWPHQIDNDALPKTGSAVGLPLYRDSVVVGVILFIHPEVGYFNEARTPLLEEIAGLIASAINNTAESQPQAAVNLRYQTIFDDAVVPMLLTDMKGEILRINHMAESLLESDLAGMVGKSIKQVHDIDLDSVGEVGLDGLAVNEEMSFRTTAITTLKDEIPVIVRARRLQFGSRHVIEWLEQDITAQMELEQLRRDLSAMVYHDLRGPLQTILGSMYKLASVLANHENPAVRTLLNLGVQSTRQLRRMIDSLLDVQRLEEGSSMLNRNEVEMRVALTDAIQLVQPIAMDAGQKLTFDIDPNLPLVSIDNDMIVRVIVNLAENAIKYTPAGGSVHITGKVEGENVVISIQDSGPGIAPEAQAQIFDKFSRVKYKDAPKGVGLGLAFCRLAVSAHGGEIKVQSAPGEGATFSFTLPITSSSDDVIEQLVTTA